ncbi:MAG: hypothetical protein HXX09_11765 [Bacteroidetes bacterium]|nr:hypothetical protein [Bacteroidota bacterium]
MKRVIVIFVILMATYGAKCQEQLSRGINNEAVAVRIDGYKTNDTIKLDDFLRLSELSLNNKEYSIASYKFSYTKHGVTKEVVAKSNELTDTIMYNLREEKNDKKYYSVLLVHIDNIKLKSKDGSKKVAPPLTYFIKK